MTKLGWMLHSGLINGGLVELMFWDRLALTYCPVPIKVLESEHRKCNITLIAILNSENDCGYNVLTMLKANAGREKKTNVF